MKGMIRMLAKNNSNVVKLETGLIHDQVEKYLTKLKYNSEQTEKAYRKDIELFFKLIKGKRIEHLTKDDVQITLDDFEDFIKMLYDAVNEEGERQLSNKSINRKVSAAKGILRYLAAKKTDGEPIVKDVSYMTLIESLPEFSKHHGVLESSEVFQIAEWIWQTERNKGDIKRLAILFSFDTCARLNEVLSMKWSNFTLTDTGEVRVNGIGKGNKEFRNSISRDFYNEILTLKTDKTDKVFDISDRRINDMMARIRDHFGLHDRSIVFHSFRKAGATFRYRISGGDILEVKRALNHSNLNTTQLYLESQNYGSLGAVSMNGKLDLDMYKKVEHDVLLEAIGLMKKDVQLLINMKLHEITKEKGV